MDSPGHISLHHHYSPWNSTNRASCLVSMTDRRLCEYTKSFTNTKMTKSNLALPFLIPPIHLLFVSLLMPPPVRKVWDCDATPQEICLHRALYKSNWRLMIRGVNGGELLLKDTVSARKKDFTLQQLSHNASHWPNINWNRKTRCLFQRIFSEFALLKGQKFDTLLPFWL